MIERLLTLGLGTVVTERVGAGDLPIATAPGGLPSLSVTPESCPKQEKHKLFECRECGWKPPRDVRPDPRVK